MNDAVFWLCLFALVILTSGEPDLLDAITKRVSNCPSTEQPASPLRESKE